MGEINTARRIGHEEGVAEGREEAKLEVAKRMLAAGMAVEQISELSGLALDEVKKL